MKRGNIIGRQADFAFPGTTDQGDEAVHGPLVARSFAVTELQCEMGTMMHQRRIRLQRAISGRELDGLGGDGRTKAELERAYSHGNADVQPSRPRTASRPFEAGPAAEINGQHSATYDLQPGMARIHLGVGQGNVARVVATDEREWHGHRALGATDALGQVDSQMQG
jgi:hypothetical protein